MRLLGLLAAGAASLLLILPASAAPFPGRIALPDGFRPEGIAVHGNTFYAGSIPTGAIYRGDLRTGEGGILVEAQDGRAAIGLALDSRGRLFVAGGPTGSGFVYDGATGADIARYHFTEGPTFVNDVVVTRDSAWFTDSQQAVLYRVPIAPDGTLGAAEVLPLSGDFQMAPGFNLNGIDATPDGRTLVVIQSGTGKLFTVDPATGVTGEIELADGESLPMGDGILLHGRTLYVVQNRLNLVATVALSPDLGSGTVVSRTAHPDFDVPTTVAMKGNSLYLVNARFGHPEPDDAAYWLTRMTRP
jgi:sugar lactone lactonase YvrE